MGYNTAIGCALSHADIAMEKPLVIVESPTKARTISRIMGPGYLVKASMGHVRDLPENRFGVDLARDFAPEYRVIPGKQKIVSELKRLAQKASDIFMATDEDREGEAIAWHTAVAIGRDPATVRRIAFHEITPEAVRSAFRAPREISMVLVNAQQARRILDRIVGYSLSPLLQRHLQKGLSAGRVQSVALRLIVDREKEIEAFVPRSFWVILAEIEAAGGTFVLPLVSLDGRPVNDETFPSEESAAEALALLRQGTLTVSRISRQDRTQSPPPPFVTSTLQQEGNTRLGFSSSKTMAIAQQLYEGVSLGDEGSAGLITYMRTDSPSVASQAQAQAFRFIARTWGSEYVPDRPPVYRARLATAQEAHEAIRPTSVERTPEKVRRHLTPDQADLYELVFRRFVASQMTPARIRTLSLEAENGRAAFRGEKNEVVFPGFTAVWPVRFDAGIAALDSYAEGDTLPVKEYRSERRQTRPPSRYTEATLIRALEKHGIGRPSTYAPTISTLISRGYVSVQRRFLVPEKMGRAVTEILVKFFPDLLDPGFTARMEDELDSIAAGEANLVEVLRRFYDLFKPVFDRASAGMRNERALVASFFSGGRSCPKCGGALVLRSGTYGAFLGCAAYPSCTYTERVASRAHHTRHRSAKQKHRAAVTRKVR